MRPMQPRCSLATLAAVLPVPGPRWPAQEGPAALVVHLGDGSSLPLRRGRCPTSTDLAPGFLAAAGESRSARPPPRCGRARRATPVGMTLEISTQMA